MVIISHVVTLAQPLLREEQQQEREDEFSIHRPAMHQDMVSNWVRYCIFINAVCEVPIIFTVGKAVRSTCGK